MPAKSTPQRYGAVAVTIHWFSAALVLGLMITGLLSDRVDGAAKQAFLVFHLPFGILLALLTIGRLIWWWRFDRRPQPVATIKPWQQKLSGAVHGLLYLTLVIMLASGIGLSVLSGAPDAVFGGTPMPDFHDYLPRTPHGIASKVLGLLLLLHTAGALVHHYVDKDETLKRMWFAKASR